MIAKYKYFQLVLSNSISSNEKLFFFWNIFLIALPNVERKFLRIHCTMEVDKYHISLNLNLILYYNFKLRLFTTAMQSNFFSIICGYSGERIKYFIILSRYGTNSTHGNIEEKKNSFSILLLFFRTGKFFFSSLFLPLYYVLYIYIFYIFEFPLRHIHWLESRVREWTTFLLCCFLGLNEKCVIFLHKKNKFFLCGCEFFSRDNFKHVLEKLEVKIFYSSWIFQWFSNVLSFQLESSCKSFLYFWKSLKSQQALNLFFF